MKRIIVTLAIMLFASGVFAQEGGDRILGKWLTEGGKSHVVITKRNGKYYGKVVKLKNPLDENGKVKLDKENPDESLRNRTIVGIEVLQDFVYDPDEDEWVDGTIYDPENGKTYSCVIRFGDDNNTLDVRGYIGFSWIGRTTVWTRVE